MTTEQIVSLLIAERDKLTRAIEALGAPVKRRGRPPGSVNKPATSAGVETAERKRKALTPVQRAAHADRMKAYWAAWRKKREKTK